MARSRRRSTATRKQAKAGGDKDAKLLVRGAGKMPGPVEPGKPVRALDFSKEEWATCSSPSA
jgi:hypothetical protein